MCGSLLSITARAEDWPQWRGPKRDGVSAEKGLLKEWPKDGPKLLWQVKDIGFGFGSPAVAGNRAYLISNRGLENEFVQALDIKDGKQIWSARLGKVGNPEQQPSYPGARSTPTVDGPLLYALGSDGDLACLETATGKVKWTKSLRTDFGGKSGNWAYAESPLVDGDKLIVTPGGTEATVVALNKITGDVLWKSAVPGGDPAGYASPLAVEIGGIKQYIHFLGKGLVGIDAATGRFLWRFDKTSDLRTGGQGATPVVSGGAIYCASNFGGGGLARIKGSAGTFEAEPVYTSKKLPIGFGGAVKFGDYLYGTGGPALQCVEFATGKIVWEERGIGAGSVCIADGRIYVHGENGDVALVEATSEGYREKGRFTPSDPPERARTPAFAYPIVTNGKLYIREQGTLWCYDVRG
jgi:outer membrane protein assembly factor BamB